MNPLESGLRYKWNPNTGFEVPDANLPEMTPQRIGYMLGIVVPLFLIGCKAFGISVDSPAEATAAAELIQTAQALAQATAEAAAAATPDASAIVLDYLQAQVQVGHSIGSTIEGAIQAQFGDPNVYAGYAAQITTPDGFTATFSGAPGQTGRVAIQALQELANNGHDLPAQLNQMFAGTEVRTQVEIGLTEDMFRLWQERLPANCHASVGHIQERLQQLSIKCGAAEDFFQRTFDGSSFGSWAPVNP